MGQRRKVIKNWGSVQACEANVIMDAAISMPLIVIGLYSGIRDWLVVSKKGRPDTLNLDFLFLSFSVFQTGAAT